MDTIFSDLIKNKTNVRVLNKQVMSRDDFDIIRSWCIKEGWNLGLYDASIYYQTDQSGHFLFFDDKIPVGSMSLVKHSEYFFTIGPFIVRNEMRGKGYGAFIWQSTLERIKDFRGVSIMLYAVSSQVGRYKTEGFQPFYKNLRWNLNVTASKAHHRFTKECVDITDLLLEKICRYDQRIFTASRYKSFKEMFSYPGVKGVVDLVDDQVRGYGIIRPCIEGYRVGPLFADTGDIACSILAKLLRYTNSENVIIDVPEPNKDSYDLMLSFGAIREPGYDTIAMIKGPISSEYEVNLLRNYGIFSLEIG